MNSLLATVNVVIDVVTTTAQDGRVKRPVAYLRKSKVQNDRHVSWEVQEAEIRALSARNGDTDLNIMSDWGRSGRGEKTRLRPEYQRLRAMIEADEVSVVYAYSLSRLSRSLGEYASLAELCRDHGVRVRLAKEGEFDYASASGRFTVGILALLAQMEAELAQERARDTIQARRARGDHIGSAGFGKRLENGTLVDHPDEDLADVTAAYRDAGSFAGAAKILNRHDVSSKFGKSWSGTTVKRVLTTGAPSELTGRRVEARVRQRGSFVLSRLLRCPCGQIMTGRRDRTRTKYGTYGPYTSYQCYRGRFEPDHPRPYAIREHALIPWIIAEAARLRVPVESVTMAADAEGDAARLVEERRKLALGFARGGLDDETYAAEDDKLAAALAAIEDRGSDLIVPQAVDWTQPPAVVNELLRAMWKDVTLGPDLLPVEAMWRREEWRA
jgi:DNA invertase Pin-like site-specific DNA recombinase